MLIANKNRKFETDISIKLKAHYTYQEHRPNCLKWHSCQPGQAPQFKTDLIRSYDTSRNNCDILQHRLAGSWRKDYRTERSSCFDWTIPRFWPSDAACDSKHFMEWQQQLVCTVRVGKLLLTVWEDLTRGLSVEMFHVVDPSLADTA